eukprot:TRINITY_DN3565_c0_g1_i6.p2 TRINITY_DN3565_c0_g1~~TRINITY_DN3565_c0_g1_i6.p2  ORF type:complete len:103 (-),score=3.13 TRINITY_DN3565_c0_g1_i6:161-469(-)
MLRSLVGSEMCIRDSIIINRHVHVLHVHRHVVVGVVLVVIDVNTTTCVGCLAISKVGSTPVIVVHISVDIVSRYLESKAAKTVVFCDVDGDVAGASAGLHVE